MTSDRWRLLFWAALAFAFVMAVMPHPPRLPGAPNDKVQHIIAFTTLAMLGRMAFPKAVDWRLLAGLSLYGALIELVQLIPALNRDGDVIDWIADTAAVAVVLALFRLARR
ncbi:MAG: VanZ family protein [Sphingomicrobium sp.]